MLRVDAISSGYGRVPVLHDVTIHVAEGETLTVLGANGAGKTTLLKSIVGLVPLRTGRITLAGDVAGLT